MNSILLLDVSVGSGNRGDDIIMECVRKELSPLMSNCFELNLPTHVSAFNWYQVWRNSNQVQMYANCALKFVGGSNLLVPNLLTHYPQWNISLFNSKPFAGSVLVGVGAGSGAEKGSNFYTKYLYRRILSKDFFHSARDERSKIYIESLGLKAINTGCVTMWALTPEHCREIPHKKSDRVVFTLTNGIKGNNNQLLIDSLLRNYKEVFFWPQGRNDYSFLSTFKGIESISVIPPTLEAYANFLKNNDTDYVGTRLHGGIYAMRHKRRAIIISVDERAKAINEGNHLNCIDFKNICHLDDMINSEFPTCIVMPYNQIEKWKSQFGL